MEEKIKNIKIAVHNEEESRKVQEKLFELGAEWYHFGQMITLLQTNYLYTRDGMISFSFNKKSFDEFPAEEIYVEDLLAIVPEDKSLIDKQLELFYPIEYDSNGSIDYNTYEPINACKTKDILEAKQKILEDFKNKTPNSGCRFGISDIEEILDKRIGG